MRRPQLRMPSPAMVVACISLAVALGGTGYAAIKLPRNSVGTTQLKANAVTGTKVKDGSLAAKDIGGPLPRGPRGPQGPKGSRGDDGATTPASPARSGFASRDIGATPLPLTPTDSYVEVMDLAVPAGSSGYSASSGVVSVPFAGRLTATADIVIVNGNANVPNLTCRFMLGTGSGSEPFGGAHNTLIASNEYLIVPLTGGVDVPSGSYNVRLQCAGAGPSFTFHRGSVTVVVTPR